MTTDEEKLVTENINMAYDIAWKYYKKFSSCGEYEDFKSEALLGLTKAAATFSPAYKFAFSTYAYKVMQNQILIYLRQCQKNTAISLYNETYENLQILDSIASNDNIEDNLFDILCRTDVYKCIASLPERLRLIIQYRLSGLTMEEIGKQLKLSQPQISRDYHTAINRLKSKLKHWR